MVFLAQVTLVNGNKDFVIVDTSNKYEAEKIALKYFKKKHNLDDLKVHVYDTITEYFFNE